MALTRATDNIIANADGNLNLSGIVTAQNFKSGAVSISNGIVTATKFIGDISDATGASAGLGTALSNTQTSPLNKLYYTNEILSIGATITVDHPSTGTGAYTQYADLRLEEGADLIISDGDDVIPDILGLGTDGGGLGAGGSGRIRVDSITNKNANGAPNLPNGVTGTSATFTTATITGNLGVGGVLTYEDVTNVDAVGILTARSGIRVGTGGTVGPVGSGIVTYFGDGSQLTGIDAGTLKHNNNTKAQATANGVTITGDLIPAANNTHDLGSTAIRWANIFTNDLHLSNQGRTNSVDSTWGDYTIQEGENDLFLINNRSGKKFKFNLTEVL